MSRDLTTLFDPKSVAIIGATDDTSKYGNWIAIRALRGARPVHLVNPRRSTVLGRPTVPDLRTLGEPVDLAVIAVNASRFEDAVDDALVAGVTALVGISAGLGEAGAEGRIRQERLAERIRGAGASLLGPNCLGVLDHTTGLELTSNDLPAGRVALISQSGNIALEIAELGADHGVGFSRFASLGNQADLEVADLVEACALHEGTDAIAVYAEDFRDGRRFIAAATEAARLGKPVVLLAVGRGSASARGAASHTGAMVSSGVVVEAACRAAGVELVSTPTQLVHLLQGLALPRTVRGRAVAVFADGGGQASVASDCVEDAGMAVEEFSSTLRVAVAADLPPAAGLSNPVDVAGGGEQDIGCFPRVLATLTGSAEVDTVVMTGYFGGYGGYSPELGAGELEAAHRIAEVVGAGDKPVVVQTMNHRSAAADILRAARVPVYRSIEDAVWTLRRIVARSVPAGAAPLPPAAAPLIDTGYMQARRVLAEAGLPFVEAVEVTSREQLLATSPALRYPLVLKALGDEHKSDRGGVVLGLPDAGAVLAAYDGLQVRLAPPAVSVEEMADLTGAVELIVGGRWDPRFGPVVLVGLGGVYTEVLRDVRCALGPLDAVAARRLLLDLRGAPLLTGARGRPPIDLDAAADVVACLSTFAAAHPEIAEIECNPVAAGPSGAVCLDARIVLADQQDPSAELKPEQKEQD
ncbi:acetate--CoA ligase family protein [Pseudonocardia sp. TRM90224]|uniref:acetate--CoA ligase family protein n=1 Tax=Pseudonocardia sp. TRM90224 TaxID=2812678 RepID=UPI001E64F12E|nr:acetate--CoA ligase [Pseudonocardia sp. TRM90224]